MNSFRMTSPRTLMLALGIAVLLATPVLAQPGCDRYDSGLLRPVSDPNPDPACGGKQST